MPDVFGASTMSTNDLEALRALKRRARDLAATHLEALDLFYLGRDLQSLTRLADGPVMVSGFANVMPSPKEPRDGTARASLASTAACVRSLLVCAQVKPGHAHFAELVDQLADRYEDEELSTYGLDHLNAFTVGQLLPVLAEMTAGTPDVRIKALVSEASDRLRRELNDDGVSLRVKTGPGTSERRFRSHGYLTYWALHALAAWGRYEDEKTQPSLHWSETELYRQVCLFQTSHDERSDAYQLGYNLLVQYRFNRSRMGTSLVELGLRTLFSAQLDRGVWEKRDPLFRYGDQGEAYCFTFELLSSLLHDLRGEWSLLVPYEEHLTRAMEWAARNALRQHNEAPVWCSPHRVEGTMPEAWATAEVYTFLQLYASYLSWRIQAIVQAEFRYEPAQRPNPSAFEALYQPEVRLPGEESVLLGTVLRDRLLEPLRLPGDPPRYSLVRSSDPRSKARSGILFGPPGTGKTTYVRKVADYLGWPLIILDPSVFAQEGLPLISTVASRVFSKLLELEDTVILFDEMEALMHTRTDGAGSFEQKFLTTSLLPKLQGLADRAACLFFVATNHFDLIDRAALRPGRFDFKLQVLPPSYEEKLRLAQDRLGPEIFEMVEADLRRRPYQENLRLASRSEMVMLCAELKRRPRDAEQILSHFKAQLMDDEQARDGQVEAPFVSE